MVKRENYANLVMGAHMKRGDHRILSRGTGVPESNVLPCSQTQVLVSPHASSVDRTKLASFRLLTIQTPNCTVGAAVDLLHRLKKPCPTGETRNASIAAIFGCVACLGHEPESPQFIIGQHCLNRFRTADREGRKIMML